MVASQSGTVAEWSWVVVAGVVAGMVVVVVVVVVVGPGHDRGLGRAQWS